MNISTKGGDNGKTSLMFGQRVSKCCERVRAYGAVDEFTSALGLARSFCENDNAKLAEEILEIQYNLVKLMTELATSSENFPKLIEKNMPILSEGDLKEIEAKIDGIEACGTSFCGWQIPGACKLNAALNMARAICRRAETDVICLHERDPLPRPLPHIYLNRLADLLFLWACKAG